MKNKIRRVKISVRPARAALDEVFNKWEKTEQGLPIGELQVGLTFTDIATMLSTLSGKRMELLMLVHKRGPMSIKRLARELHRDYSNVHGDVKTLLRVGLLSRNKHQEIAVPWDELSIQLPMAA